MSSRNNPRNNLIAGLFLLGGVLLAVVASFVLTDFAGALTRTNTYVVRFDILQGATGLDRDAEVRLGGQPVGTVADIDFDDEAGYAVKVTIKIRRDIPLYADARIHLEVPLLGSASVINIVSLGTEQAGPATGPIEGRLAPPALLAQAGYGDEQRTQLQSILDRLDKGTEKMMKFVDDADPDLTKNVSQIVADVRDVVRDARERWPEWSASITTTIERSNEFSAKLRDLADRAGPVLDKGEGLLDSARSAIDDNRPRIDRIVENVESVTAKVNDEWIPRGTHLLDRATTGVDRFTEIGDEAYTLVRANRPTIDGILADSRLAADQLKLATVEIRSQPWRMLHRPSTKELETQLLYDSARSYAAAVSDLRAASQALDALLVSAQARPTLSASEAEQIAGWRDQLVRAFARYAEAEQRLLDQMMQRAP
ncbi:MAG TPA: MlaD family protein [Phycisphaerales bacterium]|nr:MlaD family protein [Phycisphaerales bacterium]